MLLLGLAIFGLAGSLFTLVMTWVNLRLYRPAGTPERPAAGPVNVSVCIPARDEQANLADCVTAVLASDPPPLEVLLYDDASEDDTFAIIQRLVREHDAVRQAPTTPKPGGWVGKQHACDQLGQAARGQWLLFLDADVRLQLDAVGRAVTEAQRLDVAMVSAFPRQIVGSLLERLVVPMIFFLLLSYLPLWQMRRRNQPSVSAGCGQFLLVRADAYHDIGGHGSWHDSMHDGIRMPRALRAAGHRTDLIDGTDLASVRMYDGPGPTIHGFAKNSVEAFGSFGVFAAMAGFHLLVHVLPWVLLPTAILTSRPILAGLAAAAVLAQVTQRLLLLRRFDHSAWLAWLHPLAVLSTLAVHAYGCWLHLRGLRTWRGRSLADASGERVVLIDDADQPVATADKLDAHMLDAGAGEQAHLAFSVVLHDGRGQLLLQQRAAGKYHFANRWSNTCCGHPRPGEPIAAAAARRLHEELGVEADLRLIGRFRYTAEDPRSGLRECELDHVLTGTLNPHTTLQPNPEEVQATAWHRVQDLRRQLIERPEKFSPWLPRVLEVVEAAPASVDAAQPHERTSTAA
jgi:isopentenyl-diphosphate delta-isomerase type 1